MIWKWVYGEIEGERGRDRMNERLREGDRGREAAGGDRERVRGGKGREKEMDGRERGGRER